MSGNNFNYDFSNQDGFSSSMDTSNNNSKREFSNKNLRPVTIKQIYNSQQPVPDGPFKLNGKDLAFITLIGKIHKVQSLSTNIIYTIEDGTGSIDVRIWIDTSESDTGIQKRSLWSEGAYVKVVGTTREYHDKRSVMGFHIHLIEDFNEVTAHFLEIIKINLEDGNKNNAYENDENKNLPAFKNTAYAPQNYNNNNMDVTTNGYSYCQQAIIDLIKSQNLGEEGMHIETIVKMLHRRFSEEEIKGSIDWLISECHLYNTTLDETHVNLVQF